MSVAAIDGWRLPGCGDLCWPRRHDPQAHEAHGRLLEREAQRQSVVRTGPLTVDLPNRSVSVSGRAVHLSMREWQVLAYYAERPGQWCLAMDMVGAIWGGAGKTTLPNVRRKLRIRLGEAGALIESQGAKNGTQWTRLRMTEAQP